MTIKVNHPQLEEVMQLYFEDELWQIEAKESGVNNTTRFCTYHDNTYVLRVYDNHADVDKVLFELAVLEQLQSFPLSFRVPKPRQSLQGDAYVMLPSGKIAVLFDYIEGERADLTNTNHVYKIGRAVAELVTSLAQVRVQVQSAYEPYYELDQIHPLVTRDKLNE